MVASVTDELAVAIADGVATLTLNRPAAYNALTAPLLRVVAKTLLECERDPAVRALILTGEGKAFCAGQALDDAETLPPDGRAPDMLGAVRDRYNPVVRKLLTIEKPVVAAVNGVAAGAGMGFALACDLRVVSEEATFTTAFAKIGLVPDSGLSFLLPRMIGYGRAMEAALLSEKMTAQQAYLLGLVTRLVPREQVLPTARELAAALAKGPRSLGMIKRELLRNGLSEFDAALAYEGEMQAAAGATADFAEGVAAFRAKRAPAFTGT